MDPLTLTRRALLGFLGTGLAFLALVYREQVSGVLSVMRHALLRVALVGVGLVFLSSPGRSEELGAGAVPTSGTVVIHDAAETLRDWCRTDESGVLRFVLPGGASYDSMRMRAFRSSSRRWGSTARAAIMGTRCRKRTMSPRNGSGTSSCRSTSK